MVYGRTAGDKITFRESFSSSFDGSTSFSYKESFLSNSSNFSLHLDIAPNVTSSRQVIFSFGELSSNTVVFDIGISTNDKLFFYDGTTETEIGDALTLGIEYKVDFVYDGLSIFVYLNNDLTTIGFSIDDDINYNDIVIGESVDGIGEYYNGLLSNVSIFSKSLTYKDVNVISGGSNVWTPASLLVGTTGTWLDFTTDSRGTYAAQPTIANRLYTSGVTGWNAATGAALSVLPGVTPEGYNALRVTNTTANGAAWQARGITGNTYYLRQWVRGDGTTIPRLYFGGVLVTGTASTSWQLLEDTIVCGSNTAPYMMAAGSGYADFGPLTAVNISLTQFDPRAATGALAGSALVQATPADMPWFDDGTGVRFDSTTDELDLSLAKSAQHFVHDGTGMTLVCAVTIDTLSDFSGLFGNSRGANASYIGMALYVDSAGRVKYNLNNGTGTNVFEITSSSVITATSKAVISLRMNSSGAEVRVGGVAVGSDTSATGSPSASDAYDTLIVGNVGDGGLGTDGTIHEWVLCNSVFTDAELALVEASLA